MIQASSNEGDVVPDPFCGCGTTIAAAQKLNREWTGIDVTHLAVGLMKLRLQDSFNMVPVGTKRQQKAPLLTKEGWHPLRVTGWFSLPRPKTHRSL
ncbi:MAG: hypothetical protein IPG67_14430 [Acidobacteria bacterium]|nr:hypothetical protein [Acidobacteriota bacterium]